MIANITGCLLPPGRLLASQGAEMLHQGLDLVVGKLVPEGQHYFLPVFVGEAVADGIGQLLVRHSCLDRRVGVVTDFKLLSHGRVAIARVAMALLTVLPEKLGTVGGEDGGWDDEGGGQGEGRDELLFHGGILPFPGFTVNVSAAVPVESAPVPPYLPTTRSLT